MAATILFALSVALAQTEPSPPDWLAFDNESQPEPAKESESLAKAEEAAKQAPAWEKPLPLSLSLEYALMSDYVFRGMNYSEFEGEGRELPNHQLSTSLSLDLAPLWGRPKGEYGEIGFDTWFEWFAGQKQLNTSTGENIQEIDYGIWYLYKVKPLATDVKVGWWDYVYPNLIEVNNDDRTNEWFLSLAHNDAWMWRWTGYQGEEGILNPTLDFYHDMHISRGCWMDLGISHPFELVKNLTLTPSYMLHIDMGYSGALVITETGSDDHDTRIAGMTYGLDLTYDLTELLKLPAWAGKMYISGCLCWFDPTPQFRHYTPTVHTEDTLYGGVKLGWSW